MINDEEVILKHWQEYIEELYKIQDLDENIPENMNSVEEFEIGHPF